MVCKINKTRRSRRQIQSTSSKTSAFRPTRQSKGATPNAHTPGAMFVTDGQEVAGSLVVRDRSFFAFGADGVLIGEFESQREAIHAIPKAK